MCNICHRTPHLVGCPEYVPIIRCSRCKDEIPNGAEYARYRDKNFCEDCLVEMPYSEIAEALGGEWCVSGEE